MIIIEGLDATGKSTLAAEISKLTGWPIQPSEGPEKHPGEIIDRCSRYLKLSDFVIFDRHPIISQSIYGPLAKKTLIPPSFVQELRRRDPLIIEASHDNRLHHVLKEHDTPEHIEMITRERHRLQEAYRTFFINNFPTRLVFRLQHNETIIQSAVAYARRRVDNEKIGTTTKA